VKTPLPAGEFLLGMDYPERRDSMEHAIQRQTTETDPVYFASLVFQDVNETLQNVHTIVSALLRYAEIGASIADTLIEWSAIPACNEI
jgi:hypothetical protein